MFDMLTWCCCDAVPETLGNAGRYRTLPLLGCEPGPGGRDRYTSALRSEALIMSMITTEAITMIICAAVSP